MSEVTAVLKRAKQIIEEDGWTQGTYGDNDGPVCALGAIRRAIYGQTYVPGFTERERESNLYRSIGIRIAEIIGDPNYPFDGLVQFNDTHGRTKEEVLKVFNDAISLGDSNE